MREKDSLFNRAISDSPPDEELNLYFLKRKFEEQENDPSFDYKLKELLNFERDLTREEKQLIFLANRAVTEYLKKYGLDRFDFPRKNIHIIREGKHVEEFEPLKKGGWLSAFDQSIFIRDKTTRDRAFLLLIFIHEFIHFRSFHSLRFKKVENGQNVSLYRSGISQVSYKNNKESGFFINLEEGLTEEIAKQIFLSLKNEPFLKKDLEETESNRVLYPDWTKPAGGPAFNEENVISKAYASIQRGRIQNFAYLEERHALNNLIDKIYSKNKDKFESREEVMDEFIEAKLSGHMISLGRLIDKTFGPGTFHKIAEADQNISKLKSLIDSF